MELLKFLFGGDVPLGELSLIQAACRAAVVYLFGLAVVRVGKSRLLSNATPLDVLLIIILGSLLSRAITGSAGLSTTLTGCAALVALHRLMTVLTFFSHPLGNLLKGRARPLIQDGQLQWDQMRQSHISEHDLEAAVRLHGHLESTGDVRVAIKERSGEISVIPSRAEPQIVEVGVEAGVQRVRIEWVR